MVINALLILGALLGSAFISAAESALLSARPSHIQHLAEGGDRRADAVMRVLERHENFFATILLVGNLFNILVATASTSLIINSIGGGENTVLTTIISTAVATVMVYIVGELTPKTLGAIAPETWSLAVAHIILAIMTLFKPIVWIFALLPRGLLRIFGLSASDARPGFTQGELSLIIDQSQEQGLLDDAHGEMLDNLIDFGARDLRDHRVRVHTSQIVWLNENDTLRTFLQKYREHLRDIDNTEEPHRFQPGFVVQRGEPLRIGYWYHLEQLAGAIYSNDVMRFIAEGGDDKLDTEVSALMRSDILVLADITKLDDLFKEMIRTEQHLAVAHNDENRINGLVTLNGLLEMMRGDDDDTLVIEQKAIERVADDTFLLPGALSVERTRDETGIEVPQNERYETVAGFFIDRAQKMPSIGQCATYNDEIFMEVLEMDGNRIERLKIQNIATEAGSEQNGQ
ncbi:MAG: HlyC/CorC family transporter [Chloroflexi bacterium]|nr:HlyC/CorC family transporter [Chloroflexota bacterium]